MLHWQRLHNNYELRTAYALLIACVVSFLLFSIMQYLVSGGSGRILEIPGGSTMQFIRLKQQSETQLKQRQLPTKPSQTKKSPSKPIATQDKVNPSKLVKPALDMPAVPIMALNSRPSLGKFDRTSIGGDNNLMPLVRIEPQYPRNAARSGTEGWVEVKFTVLEDGTVSAVKVIKAEPKRIFNRAALRAISKWKFSPKIVDGKPVKQSATQVIQFKLAK